jgi:hypothetical protein
VEAEEQEVHRSYSKSTPQTMLYNINESRISSKVIAIDITTRFIAQPYFLRLVAEENARCEESEPFINIDAT